MNLQNKIKNISSFYLRDILTELHLGYSGGQYVTLNTTQTVYGSKLFEGAIRMRNVSIVDETGGETNYVKPLLNNGNFFIRDNTGANLIELNKVSKTTSIRSGSSMGFGLSHLGLSQYRTYQLPDKDGTIALADDLNGYLLRDGSNIASQYYDMNNPTELIMFDTTSGKFTKASNPFKFEASKTSTSKEMNIQGSTYRYNSATNVVYLGGGNAPSTPMNSTQIRNVILAGTNVAPNLISKDEGDYRYNQNYLIMGNDIYNSFTGDTNYRPNHPAHDSHVLVGHGLAGGVLDGTNVTMLGTSNMHINTTPYWDSITIVGKGNTNNVSPYNDPNRVATSVSSGYNMREQMGGVNMFGSENWFGDIHACTIIGNSTKIYRYAFNSIVIGNENQNFGVIKYPNEPDLDLFLDNDIIIGNGNYKDPKRYAPTHNLIIGSTNSYGTGGTFNPNLLPLIEGNFLSKWFRVNGTLEATANDDHIALSQNLATIPNMPGILSGTSTSNTTVLNGNDTDMIFATLEVGKTYQMDMYALDWETGTWGYTFGDITDSGNTYWTAKQVFINSGSVPINFTVRTTNGAKGRLFIEVKELMVQNPIKPAFVLRDSDENISVSAVVTKASLKNTIYGRSSGQKVSSATNITLFGNNVGTNIVAFSNITAMGTDVMTSSRVREGVGMGYNVFTNADGGSIVGIGNNVAPNNVGSWVIGIGNNTFKNSTNASSTIAIGNNSQESNNGSFMVSLGISSVSSSYTNVSSGVVIGHGANPLFDYSNNEIVIGAFATGNGSNTTTIGTTATTATYLRGTVWGGSFARYGGTGTNVLLDDGSVKPLSELSGGSTTITNYVTTDTNQNVSGVKTYLGKAIFAGGTGASYTDGAMQIMSSNSYAPTLSFHKLGEYANNIASVSDGFELRDQVGTGYVSIKALGFKTPTGTGTRVLLDNGTTKLLTDIVSGDYLGKVGVQNVTTTSTPYSILGSSSSGFKIDTNGNVSMQSGSNTISVAGSGINFTATQSTFSGGVTATTFTTANGNSNEWNTALVNRGTISNGFNVHTLTTATGYYALEIPNGSGNVGFPKNAYGTYNRIKSSTFITDLIFYQGAVGTRGMYFRTYPNNVSTDIPSVEWLRAYTTDDFSATNITNWNSAYSWGNHATAGYALANGSNATGTWIKNARGLALNPAPSELTLGPSGQTDLANATYGTTGGIVQDSTGGPIAGAWCNRIKILHNNSEGYFTELAQNFTGEEGLWHRRCSVVVGDWVRVFDTNVWSNATLTNNSGTLSITIGGVTKTVPVGSGSGTYTEGTNIEIRGNVISVVNSPTFSGSVYAPSFFETSLRKYKENIKPFKEKALDMVNGLDIVTYDRKDGIKGKIGVIADDTANEFLSEKGDAVDLYNTIFIQAKAIQELTKRIEELEKKLEK